MKALRVTLGLALVWLMHIGMVTAENVAEFKNSNDYDRLRAQTSLDENAPYNQSTRIQAHNAFNSKAYAFGINYIDPNHKLSTTDLLEMGIRDINYDVHYILNISSPWPWEWKKKLMLCHAQSSHVGCSGGERYLSEGMEELAVWMEKNPNELVYLSIQDEMEGQHAKAAQIIEDTVGDKVYHPAGATCSAGIPMSMSRREIMDTGKTLVITGKCGAAGGWDHLAFSGIKRESGVGTGTRGGNGNTDIVVNGECFGKFDQDDYDHNSILIYEDSTALGKAFTDTPQISAGDIEFALSCGVNTVGLDQIHPNDDARIDAYLWSWAVGEPNNNNDGQDCLRHNSSGRFYDYRCDNNQYSFGCQNEAGDWYVTNSEGVWDQGNAICTAETDGEYVFSVPVNKVQNERLIEAKFNKSISNLWLNFTDQGVEGQWLTPSANVSINFNERSPQNYGDQTSIGDTSVEDNGATLRLTGNNWQSIELDYVITPNTVVELDFSSSIEAELHGFGFDVDNQYGGYKQRINFAGTQDANDVLAYDNYPMDGSSKHYVVNIGLHDSGYKHHMYFLVDSDANEAGESIFSNVRIYERYDAVINFEDHEILGYAGDDAADGGVSIEDEGATLRMTGNLWRAIEMPRDISVDTVLEFDFSSDSVGEIHGIGFDNNLTSTTSKRFELYGTQDTQDISDFATYSGNGVTHYSIPVGQFYIGEMKYLFFVMDDDAASAGESVFSNVTITDTQAQ